MMGRTHTSSSGEPDSMVIPSQCVTPAPMTAALNRVFVCVTPQAVRDPPTCRCGHHLLCVLFQVGVHTVAPSSDTQSVWVCPPPSNHFVNHTLTVGPVVETNACIGSSGECAASSLAPAVVG